MDELLEGYITFPFSHLEIRRAEEGEQDSTRAGCDHGHVLVWTRRRDTI
jgi:hypothetical protein